MTRVVYLRDGKKRGTAEKNGAKIPGQLHLSAVRHSGFTLVELMIVVGLVGLLCAIAIPSFARARVQSHRNTCINNLRQIQDALQQWAMENGAGIDGAAPDSSALMPYLRGKVVCPSGGTTFADSYALPDTVEETPTCRKIPQLHQLEPSKGNFGINGVKAHGQNANGGIGNGDSP